MAQSEIVYTSGMLLKDLWRSIQPYRGRFFFASFARLVGDVVWLYPPIALASATSFLASYEPGASLAPLYLTFGLWFAASATRTMMQLTSKRIGYVLGERMATDASYRTVGHLTKLDLSWHEGEHSGNKLKRIYSAERGMVAINHVWFNSMIEIAVNVVGVVLILGTIDTFFGLYVAAFLVIYFLLARYFIPRAALASREVNKQEEDIQGTLFEIVANIRTVKILGAAGTLLNRLKVGYEEFVRRVTVRVWRNQSRVYFMAWFAESWRVVGVILIVWGVTQGTYEVGLIMLFYLFFGRVWESIAELANNIQEFLNARFAIERRHLMELEPVCIDATEGKVVMPSDWHAVTLRDVTFSYGGGEALQGISFSVQRGEKVGVVGTSGAGKSTLFKLLLKEREDYTGEILVDDVPLRTIERESYFTHVSAVLQDTEVFNLTLKDNIAVSDEVDESALAQAIRVAHVDDFLHKLPQGLDTVVGEKGVRLSGGERQRLGIARAVYKRPELLLMDEATSHLDTDTEEKIRDSLSQFFEGVTAIVIAHRLSTIRAMDRIIVIENGRIVEEGTFDELSAQGGRFAELWEKQRA